MKRQSIYIETGRGPVAHHVLAHENGLAVWKSEKEKLFSVTHIDSGLRVLAFRRHKQAVKFIEAAGEIADWRLTFDELGRKDVAKMDALWRAVHTLRLKILDDEG